MAVADDYEQALRENGPPPPGTGPHGRRPCREHRDHEKNLQTTLYAAQKLSDDIKLHAEEEARRILREGRWPVGPASRENAEPASKMSSVKLTAMEDEAARRRDDDRIDDPDAEEHARVRPRPGAAGARGEDSHSPPAPAGGAAGSRRRRLFGNVQDARR